MEMLGTCIGPTASRGRFLARKIDDLLRVLPRLEVLPYQHALLLLRICFQQDLRHLQRTLDTSELQHLWASLDQQLQELAFASAGLGTPRYQTTTDYASTSASPHYL
jgi:hypothetical protein